MREPTYRGNLWGMHILEADDGLEADALGKGPMPIALRRLLKRHREAGLLLNAIALSPGACAELATEVGRSAVPF